MIKSKKLFESFIYFIRYDGPFPLKVGSKELPDTVLDILIKKNGIVIWENQGIFKLIPVTILHNIWLTCGTSQQLKKGYPRMTPPSGLNEISFSQGIIIPPAIVKNLLLIPYEKRNGFSDPDSTAHSTSENQTNNP